MIVGYCSPAAESVKAMLDYCSSPDTLLLELLLFQYQYRIIPILRILKKEFSGSSVFTWEWGKGGSFKAGLGLKGILHQKIFYRLNLIFWIVMGCGIADLGRRGL